MASKQGLDKKMTFGMNQGKTPREIIDSGNYKYINFLTDEKDFYFSRETYDYIDSVTSKK
jgi:hypothetical protein